MADSRFFTNNGPLSVAQIVTITGATLEQPELANRVLHDVAALDRASESELSFFDNTKYLEQFTSSAAGACLVKPKYAPQAPKGMAVLVCDDPYRAFALVTQKFYSERKPSTSVHPTAVIDPAAILGQNIHVAAGAVIGARAEIGDDVVIGANAVIGEGVVIGKQTQIGPLSSITHSLIGERVIIHRGVHIGQDGFGFALGRTGHVKVPQLGRVFVGNDVEIGSGTTIDRGAGPDTIIGDGAKIDNLVQIAHNVTIGRLAVIVAQTGISGSTRIGDGAVLAGQSGIAGHLKIGAGAKIAAKSGVMSDIPPGSSYGGSPAVPAMEWHRQSIALKKLTKRGN